VEGAVAAADRAASLRFHVACTLRRNESRATAEAMLADGVDVVVMVAPHRRRVEVVTSAPARARLSNAACAEAVEIMLPSFRRGDWIAGIDLGLAALAERATPPTHGASGADHAGPPPTATQEWSGRPTGPVPLVIADLRPVRPNLIPPI